MAKKMVIPWELKYKWLKGAYTTLFKGWLYAVREEFGADTALKLYEKILKMGDRIKNMTYTLKDVFNIEGNDCETIGKWWEIYNELNGNERQILEMTKTLSRSRYPLGCAWKTELEDISDWMLFFCNIVNKTINPKATLERPKAMCAGDSYCEYVIKIEE